MDKGKSLSRSVDEVIDELIRSTKAGETVIFAGAGISFNSGLPVVNQLVPYVLSILGVSEEDIKTFMESRFCFEELIDTLFECSEKEDAELFLDLFSEGKPNTNHILLAKLVKGGYLKTIVTTNFDLLIERALKGQGLRRGKDFEVFHREKDFEHIDWNDNKPCVVKIHGSIEDGEAMAITLHQVAKQELSAQRREIIERVFSTGKHRNVLVLGYSSSDMFDISPHIATLEGGLKRVIYVEHASNPKVEDISIRKEKNAFGQFTGSQRMYYDTDMLVKTLWGSFLKETMYRFRRGTTPWKEHVDRWYGMTVISSLGAAGSEIAGRIFYAISEFKTAGKYFEQAAAKYARWNTEKQTALEGMLGDTFLQLGDKEDAVWTYYLGAIDRARTMDDKRNLIALTSSAGDVFNNLGEPEKAGAYYKWAFSTALRIGDEKEATLQNAKWGNALNRSGTFRSAMLMLVNALKKADDIGDIRTKAVILGYLGNTYVGLEKYQKAIEYYEYAIEADRNLGYKRGEGVHLRNLGDVYRNLGQYKKAIKHHGRALKIAEAIGDDREQIALLGDLGDVYCLHGEYEKAVDCYQEALKICRNVNEESLTMEIMRAKVASLVGIGTSYALLREHQKALDAYKEAMPFISVTDEQFYLDVLRATGILYRQLEEHDKAVYYFEQALEINRKLGGRKEEVDILVNLGLSRSGRGEHQEAIEIYEKALQIARDMTDIQNEGILLINLGKVHFDLGRHSKSMEFFEQALAKLKPLLGDNHPHTKIAAKNLRAAKKRLSERSELI